MHSQETLQITLLPRSKTDSRCFADRTGRDEWICECAMHV